MPELEVYDKSSAKMFREPLEDEERSLREQTPPKHAMKWKEFPCQISRLNR